VDEFEIWSAGTGRASSIQKLCSKGAFLEDLAQSGVLPQKRTLAQWLLYRDDLDKPISERYNHSGF